MYLSDMKTLEQPESLATTNAVINGVPLVIPKLVGMRQMTFPPLPSIPSYYVRRYLPDSPSAASCRRACLEYDGCAFWSLRPGGPEGDGVGATDTCFLKSALTARRYLSEVEAVSGSLLADGCADPGLGLEGMADCSCRAAPRRKGNVRQALLATFRNGLHVVVVVVAIVRT